MAEEIDIDTLGEQVDFKIEKEDWGTYILSDGTKLMARVILRDAIRRGEDAHGISLAYSVMVPVRVVAQDDVKSHMKGKPLKIGPVPLDKEHGWEEVEIVKTERPAISHYIIDSYRVTIKLEIISVIRTLKYKDPGGNPLYNVRWNTTLKISKLRR